jgi:hypothetical protein
MKRQLLILFALAAVLVCLPITSADAAGRGGRGGFHKTGFGGCGTGGCGIGGFGIGGYNDICGYAELYRELYNNLPYFALHPPVYYSYPVPRTYGYSPFAYPPGVMTPDVVIDAQPVTIINPHVESNKIKAPQPAADRSAAKSAQPEPLVIVNPYVTPPMVAKTN